jgi:hypothetical protein
MAGAKFEILSCRIKPYVDGIAKTCGAYDELDNSGPVFWELTPPMGFVCH